MTIQPVGQLIPPPELGFGDRLRRFRLKMGMDTREFAAETGIGSHSTLSRHENADHAPRNARNIAASIQLRYGHLAAYDIRQWLLTGKVVPPGTPGAQPTGYAPHLTLIRAA
jgi:transcriptional regulator with XRE-family HTH domain